jgi:hypothetical protein
MSTTRNAFSISLVLFAVLFAGCGSRKRSQDEPAIRGTLRFDGKSVDAITSVEPQFSANNLDTGQKNTSPRAEYDKGQFTIYGLPQGRYHVFIRVNANTSNPGGYPGYPGDLFRRVENVSVPKKGAAALDVDLYKVIHLTGPQDNNDVMDRWGEKGDARIAFAGPVKFEWEPLGDDVQYHYQVLYMQSQPHRPLAVQTKESTTDTTFSIELPPSGENEFYSFHLFATRKGGRIAELITHGERGYGADLRFRVE